MYRGPHYNEKKVKRIQNFNHLPISFAIHLQAVTPFMDYKNHTTPLIPVEKQDQRQW